MAFVLGRDVDLEFVLGGSGSALEEAALQVKKLPP